MRFDASGLLFERRERHVFRMLGWHVLGRWVLGLYRLVT